MPSLEVASASAPSLEPAAPNAKRKRDDTEGLKDVQDVTDKETADGQTSNSIRDICEVLRRYDTTPSILDYAPSASDEAVPPASKKAKQSNLEHPTASISQKAARQEYQSVDHFLHDIDGAVTGIQASVTPKQEEGVASQWKYQPESLDASRLSAQVKSFRKALRTFTLQQAPLSETATAIKDEKELPNGVPKAEGSAPSSVNEGAADDRGRAVLTLFGNAQGQHKQLFSSFQKPIPPQHRSSSQPTGATSSEALMPLRENGLFGNQIVSTKLVPLETKEAINAARKRLKFKDLFHPPASLSALSPPKARSSSASRGTTITWTPDNSSAEPSRKHGFTTEKLPTGQWLGYDGLSSEQESASPEAKRRKRDRALSSGEATREKPSQVKAALEKAKEDALFRRVYSSFAPTTDNSSSLVPEEIKNDMWWNEYEKVLHQQSENIDPMLDGDEAVADHETDTGRQHRDAYKDVVENFEPPSHTGEDDVNNQNDPGTSLMEISELLESLLSHQRVRTSQLNGASKTVTSPQGGEHGDSVPNEAEVAIYEKARTRLAELIMRVPPYVLAKVDGDQLEDLILSHSILLESKNYQGTMDDDHATRVAATASLNASLGNSNASRAAATSTRPGSFSHTRTSSGQVQPGTPSTLARTNSNVPKPPLTGWQTPAQSYAASMQRPAYNPPSTYGRTPLNSYNSARPPLGQQPNGIGGGYSQTPSQPMYQQRAQNPAGQYNTYGQSPSMLKNPAPLPGRGGYQPIMSRPPSTGYNSSLAGAPQAPIMSGQMTSQTPATNSAQSPLPPGSPYVPPPGGTSLNGSNHNSRPHTPSTPAIAQAQQSQAARNSPSLAPAPTQAVTSGSSNSTPVP